MKKKIIIFLAILIAMLLGVCCIFSKNPQIAEIKGHKFQLEVANDKNERAKGLSGRENLCSDCGMLFIFPQKGDYDFWMKGMRFDLDIIWINDGKIVSLAKNIPYTSGETIKAEKSADRVLEINAGLADKYNLTEGDQIKFSY